MEFSCKKNEEKHEGSQDSRCPKRDSKREPPKYRLELLLLWQICLVRQFNSCSLQINSIFHTKNLLLDFDDTAHTTQYDKCISEVENFSLHCSGSIFNASPIESQHIFFRYFCDVMCLLSQTSGVPRKTYRLHHLFICQYLPSRHLQSS